VEETVEPFDLVRPRRTITGMAAVLLPFRNGLIDWASFESLVERTASAGLTPAVNMDTGYVNLLDPADRVEVLDRTKAVLGGGSFVAGAFVADEPGTAWSTDGHRAAMAEIETRGGLPVVFPCFALSELDGEGWVRAHEDLGRDHDRFLAFELSTAFAPFGSIRDVVAYRDLLEVKACVGAKHSSLSRTEEWARLRIRDRHRADFLVLTGNDLAIDMVVYGSDYLLGLAAFAPDVFAERDRRWADGDPSFWELNDGLQYLGAFAFREPVPGYRHNAAQFLRVRGWLDTDEPHPSADRRPDHDVDVLAGIAARLGLR
jgi:dihydrodipicolinate synthase/N-acetylneuraminate lyase